MPGSGSEALADWRLLYDRERERAEAAEARAEELRWAEVRARCEAGSWKWRWEASRRKLRGVIAATREARRAGRDALALQREVGRLHGLLREAGVDAGKRSTVMALRMEVARLRKEGWALEKALDARGAEVQNLHKARIEADADILALRRQLREMLEIHGELSKLGDQRDRVESLSEEVGALRWALKVSEASKGRLMARLRRAIGEERSRSPSAADAELRKALRRSRRQKATIGSLTREKARLGRRARVARRRIERLEGQLAKLRASRSVLPKGESRGPCERQERPRSGRRRGQQPGASGHGRTERPRLEERNEEHNPPSDARVCGGCGSPYAANGAEESALVEIEVRAYRRVIRRPRWRRTCGCASSPAEVSAPPVPRLFAPARRTERASGRASCSSATRACARCTGSPRGCPTRGCRSRRGRWRTACTASGRCSSRWARRSSPTRTARRCATPTRPAGASRRFARGTDRGARGCGPRSAAVRSTSTSIRRGAPRRP